MVASLTHDQSRRLELRRPQRECSTADAMRRHHHRERSATFSAQNGLGCDRAQPRHFLNLTTAFPDGGGPFFAAHPSVFPGGVSCTPLSALSAPFGCLHPPFGVPRTGSRPGLSAQGITLTVITASLSIL